MRPAISFKWGKHSARDTLRSSAPEITSSFVLVPATVTFVALKVVMWGEGRKEYGLRGTELLFCSQPEKC